MPRVLLIPVGRRRKEIRNEAAVRGEDDRAAMLQMRRQMGHRADDLERRPVAEQLRLPFHRQGRHRVVSARGVVERVAPVFGHIEVRRDRLTVSPDDELHGIAVAVTCPPLRAVVKHRDDLVLSLLRIRAQIPPARPPQVHAVEYRPVVRIKYRVSVDVEDCLQPRVDIQPAAPSVRIRAVVIYQRQAPIRKAPLHPYLIGPLEVLVTEIMVIDVYPQVLLRHVRSTVHPVRDHIVIAPRLFPPHAVIIEQILDRAAHAVVDGVIQDLLVIEKQPVAQAGIRTCADVVARV